MWTMRRFGVSAVAAAAAVALTWPAAAFSSCVLLTQEEKRSGADVILVGTALEDPTATGVQRFQVERYEKGAGAKVARVETGVVARPDGTGSLTSVSIEVKTGERWRIYGLKRPGGVLETNECVGSVRLASKAAPESSDPGPGDGTGKGMLVAGVGLVGLGLVALLLRPHYRRLRTRR
jgi:hypothetical protein